MNHQFNLSINGNSSFPTAFELAHSLVVNFSRTSPITEYCLTFTNTDNFSNITFMFESDSQVNCYFKFIKQNGKTKYVGCQHLQSSSQTINIANYAAFSIVIPKNTNKNLKTTLTLSSLSLT